MIHEIPAGERTASVPSFPFDAEFYRSLYAKDLAAESDEFAHYLERGRRERRYPTRAQLSSDAEKVRRSVVYDAAAFERYLRLSPLPDLDAAETVLAQWPPISFPGLFESDFYDELYPDIGRNCVIPIVHYAERGRLEGRIPTRGEYDRRATQIAGRLDARHYAAQVGDTGGDPVGHYIVHGERNGFEPCLDFSPDYYRRRFADVARGGVSPFEHYASFGVAEGRCGRPDFSTAIVPGRRRFDGNRQTIALAIHEATRTGAPLHGLALATSLAERFNLVILLNRDGELEAPLAAVACAVFVGTLDELDAEYLLRDIAHRFGVGAIVMNSVVTSQYATGSLNVGLPSVALIHEFAEYIAPDGRMANMVEASDRVVVPAVLVLDSIQRDIARRSAGRATHISIRHQGFLPKPPTLEISGDLSPNQIRRLTAAREHTRFVLGAGSVHARKGVDLFVQTACELRALGVEDFRFVWAGAGYEPVGDSYSLWLRESVERAGLARHVFFVPLQGSLDALFELASVFFLSSRLDPFPNVALEAIAHGTPLVTFESATGINELLEAEPAYGTSVTYGSARAAAEAIVRLLDGAKNSATARPFEDRRFSFDAYVAFVEDEIAQARRDRAWLVARIGTLDDPVDAAFFDADATHVLQADQRRAELRYAAQLGKGIARLSPHAGSRPDGRRHRCVILDDRPVARETALRVALHVHAGDASAAEKYLERLTSSGAPIDLFMTAAEDHLSALVSSGCLRDGRYDVVGHLHDAPFAPPALGTSEALCTYLWETLAGNDVDLLRILALFEEDPELGLVFAEDRHCAGDIAPLGAMFWARPRALAPVPDERTLRATAEAAGFTWATVYRRGFGW